MLRDGDVFSAECRIRLKEMIQAGVQPDEAQMVAGASYDRQNDWKKDDIRMNRLMKRCRRFWKRVSGPSYGKSVPEFQLLYPGFVVIVSLLSISFAQISGGSFAYKAKLGQRERIGKAVEFAEIKLPEITSGGEFLTHYRYGTFGASNPDEVDPNAPMVALTFDDGPNPKSTGRILEVLKENYSHATFFVVGTNAEQYQDTLKDIADAGCEIGNHTYNHANLTSLSSEEAWEQLDKVDRAVKKATGEGTTVIRPPYGAFDQDLLDRLNSPVVLWDVDTEDWSSRDASKIVEAVMSKVKDGDIVLMHDIYESTAEAVSIMVPRLKEEGFQILTVSEIAKYKGKELELGKAYGKLQGATE